MILRNLIIFLHNIVAFLPFALYLGIEPRWLWLMALPGVVLIAVAAFPVALILGIFCARFRDMQQIVASIVQLAFFLTPILWKPELLGNREFIATYNPFFVFIEVIRAPVYGHMPGLHVYVSALLIVAGLYAMAFPIFLRFRTRIAFWV
jgi:ABC-type polysaccharide/polyol phosphate export permease